MKEDRTAPNYHWLMCCNHFNSWGGSELVILELAEELVARGAKVSMYAPFGSMRFLKMATDAEIQFHTTCANLRLEEFDVVYVQHQVINDLLDVEAVDLILSGRGPFIIYNHLSAFEPFEMPGPFIEKVIADKVLCNSEETRSELSSLDSFYSNALVFPNPAPASFAEADSSQSRELNRILVVANDPEKDIRGAMAFLRKFGIGVTHVGRPGKAHRLLPSELATHDAVLTMGKTVQYAIRMGLPVYCYGKFGGPGWLTDANFSSASEKNFSGRCTRGQLSPRAIADSVCAGFSTAGRSFYSDDQYHLECMVDSLFGEINGTLRRGPPEAVSRSVFDGRLRHERYLYGLVRREYGLKRKAQQKLRRTREDLHMEREKVNTILS